MDGTVRDSVLPTPFRMDTLFVLVSPPLRDILPALMKPSQNQIAEILLRTIGLERGGLGTADSARKIVGQQLLAWGVQPDGFVIRDGSGLSDQDLLTPETIVRVLDRIQRDTAFAAYYNAMPIAGVDGTIDTRMKGTPAEGNVHAKTGTLNKARSLSGYVTTADGERLIFSILANNTTTPGSAVTHVADVIAAALAGTGSIDQTMLSVAEASERILAEVKALAPETVPLREALGRVLAEDVSATVTMPPWSNSSMDGYAVRSADITPVMKGEPVKLRVIATIAAGEFAPRPLKRGEAMRIMTGAPIPGAPIP